jgi:hypothetical protein
MIPKGTSHTSLPNSTFEVLKGTMKTRFEPSLPRKSAWKNDKNLHPGFEPRTPATDVSILTLDHQCKIHSLHKAVYLKILVEGTNLPNQ